MVNQIIHRIKTNQFTLIAEIGVNYYDIANKLHISIMDAAKLMVLAAKNAGVHAVKFQTYKADKLASKYSPSYWDTSAEPTTSQYELFQKFDMFGQLEYQELSDFCECVGIEFCSTPFDFESADYLDPMMNVYKISSSDVTNIPFIKYIAKKEKPIILSTGASNADEIHAAVTCIRKYNHKELVLMHCVLEYPTPYEDASLAKITSLKKEFPDCIIGYSDHTRPDSEYDVIKTAYLLGATVIEKHFTLDKNLIGNDHYHAMDSHDAEEILIAIDKIIKLKGHGELRALRNENAARMNARRSIVTKKDISAGEVVRKESLTFKRPGIGIAPSHLYDVVGKKAKIDIKRDTALQENMLE